MNLNRFLEIIKYFLVFVIYCTSFILPGQNGKPKKTIIIFGCHAVDVEQIAGGTFAKYIAEGYKGVYVCVENNLSGNQIEKIPGNWDYNERKVTGELTHSPLYYPTGALETDQMGREEALEAAKVFGAEAVFLDYVQPELCIGREAIIYGRNEFNQYDPPGVKHVNIATHISADVEHIVDLLKKYQPEITIISTLGGEDFDANEGSYIIYMAFNKAISEKVPVGKLWMNIDGWILDNVVQKSGRGKADVLVNVSGFLKTKHAAMDKFVSQNGGVWGNDVMSGKQIRAKDSVEEFITVLDNTK